MKTTFFSLLYDKAHKSYPDCYHLAVNAIILDIYREHTEHSRRTLAKAIRHYRCNVSRSAGREMYGYAEYLGFPIRLRENGRWK